MEIHRFLTVKQKREAVVHVEGQLLAEPRAVEVRSQTTGTCVYVKTPIK